MAFLTRLFRRKQKAPIEPMHGSGTLQTEAEQDATRKRMESEMASQREHRGESASPESPEEPPTPNP
jgi:hypothetical protein